MPANWLLSARNPHYPFIPPRRLQEPHIQNDMEGANRIYKIVLFYDSPELYRGIVQHFGEEHRHYRDNYDYGNQEENKDTKGSRSKSAVARNSGRSFYNS